MNIGLIKKVGLAGSYAFLVLTNYIQYKNVAHKAHRQHLQVVQSIFLLLIKAKIEYIWQH